MNLAPTPAAMAALVYQALPGEGIKRDTVADIVEACRMWYRADGFEDVRPALTEAAKALLQKGGLR